MRTRSIACLVILASLAGACGGADGTADAGAPADAARDAAEATDADGHDAATGDGNGSFATATMITVDADPLAMDVIRPARDEDYFRFDGTAGQIVRIFTVTEPPATPDAPFADTVITLYDSSMTQIAENDDGIPRASTDSEIIIRLPAAGIYYYRVQEFSTWAPDMSPDGPEGGPEYGYETGVELITSDDVGYVVDPETGDDAASAVALDFAGLAVAVGTFDGASDRDVFSFNSTSLPSRPELLTIEVMPEGPMGYGATRTAGRVWITDSMGRIVARTTIDSMIRGPAPGLLDGSHHLWIEAPSGTAGANDHYVVKLHWQNPENPRETMEATNGALATAEPRPLAPVEGAEGERAFLFGRLPSADVDYYSFDVMAGRQVSIACGSRRVGSGVLGLRAELRDSTDAAIAMAEETETANLFVDSFAIPGAGTYYLRISFTSQDAEVIGDWYRCGIYAAPPTP